MPDKEMQEEDFANSQQSSQAAIYGLPSDIISLILDPSMIIERIRRDLKGEVLMTKYVKDKISGDVIPKNFWQKIGLRVMNDKGIEMVISILNGYVNRNSIFSQMTEEEIYKITLQLDMDLNALFYSKGLEFGLDNNYKSIVKNKIVNICFFAMKQSQNAKLMEALTKFWSVRELKGFSGEKKSGIMDTLLSPLKGGNNNG